MSILKKWYKKVNNFFSVLLAGDIQNDYIDDGKPYHLLSQERSFLKTSVKGDFRLDRLQNSFCATWKNKLVCRADDGTLRWEIEGWGRCMAINPEQTLLVAVKNKTINIFNAATGQPLQKEQHINYYLDYIIWTTNNRIIAAAGDHIIIFNRQLKLLYADNLHLEQNGFISGICPDPVNAHILTVLDFNNQELKKINLNTKELIKSIPADYAEQLFANANNKWIWTTVVNGTYLEEIKIYDNKSLRERKGIPFKGKRGVRFANQSPDDISYHRWISLPSISPNNQFFLVNDNSGLLWLIDAHTGDKRRIFSRYHLNYVYASLWLDDEHFVALLEDGYILKMNIRGKTPIFKYQDLKPPPN